VIPYLGSTTGPAAAFANDTTLPAQIAVEAINAEEIDNMPHLTIKQVDSQLDPAKAVANYREIVKDDPVIVVGSYSSEGTAVAPLANADKIPFVVAFSTVPDIPRKNRPYVYSPATEISHVAGVGIEKWLKAEPSIKTVAMIKDEKDVAASAQGGAAATAIEGAGKTLAGTVGFQTGATDFAASVTRALESSPDGVVVASLAGDAVAIVQEIRRQNKDVSIYLIQAAVGPAFLTSVGPAADGAYAGTDFYASDPRVADYTAAFKKLSGDKAPGYGFPYDAWLLLTRALADADLGCTTGAEAREKIRTALDAVETEGVTGDVIAFNDEGFTDRTGILVRLSGDGSIETVK
jgi:ABC-type branched-subunit amino acid transport system substrate-binding protein